MFHFKPSGESITGTTAKPLVHGKAVEDLVRMSKLNNTPEVWGQVTLQALQLFYLKSKFKAVAKVFGGVTWESSCACLHGREWSKAANPAVICTPQTHHWKHLFCVMQDVLFNEGEKLPGAEQAKESEHLAPWAGHLHDHNITLLSPQHTHQHPGKAFWVDHWKDNNFLFQ